MIQDRLYKWISNFGWDGFASHIKEKPYEIPNKDGQNFIHRLPSELLLKIFCYLDYQDNVNLKRVCQRWRQMIGEGFLPSDYQLILQVISPLLLPVYYKRIEISQRILAKEFTLYGRWDLKTGLELKCTCLAHQTFEILLQYTLFPYTTASKDYSHYVCSMRLKYSDHLTLQQVNTLKKAFNVCDRKIDELVSQYIFLSTFSINN